MSYETIIVEIRDNVGLITLNRPDALNALSIALVGELADALRAMEKNDDVGAIVLTGSEKAFAAGADIEEMASQSFTEFYMDDFLSPWDHPTGPQADYRSSFRLCAGRWMRAGDDVRFHSRRGYSPVRTARDQNRRMARCWGVTKAYPAGWQVEINGDVLNRSHDGGGRGRESGPGKPHYSC